MKIKYWLIVLILLSISLWILLYYQWIIILFPNQDFELYNSQYLVLIEILTDISEYNELTMFNQPSLIFTFLNALIMGVYLNCLGLILTTKKRNFIVMFILIIIIFSFFGMFGIRITFNFDFLFYKSYTSNTAEGILFFTMNILYFSLIYILSFLTETETSN